LHSAVSQICNRPAATCSRIPSQSLTDAECNSAIQQIKNLRYKFYALNIGEVHFTTPFFESSSAIAFNA
jgi:hypothetical protein